MSEKGLCFYLKESDRPKGNVYCELVERFECENTESSGRVQMNSRSAIQPSYLDALVGSASHTLSLSWTLKLHSGSSRSRRVQHAVNRQQD